MKSQQKGFAHAFLTIGLVVALVGALGFIFWQNFIHQEPVANKAETINNSKRSSTKQDAVAPDKSETGLVTGKRVYGSEMLPSDFKVCAISNVTKQEVVCDDSQGNGKYSIELSAGQYLMAAETGGRKGYYTKYMASEMTVNDYCVEANHIPLVVTVKAKETIDNIHVGDFEGSIAENC